MRLALRTGLRLLPLIAVLVVTGASAWWLDTHRAHWQWAGSGSATLSQASRELASQLTKPVHLIVALPTGNVLRRHVRRLADAYARVHRAFDVEFVDPKADPTRARKLGLVHTGEGLIQYGDRFERVAAPSESHISAGLERVLRRGERFIAYLTGHGERDLQGKRNFDLGDFGNALQRKGYQLQPLSLIRAGTVPDNAAVLLVAAPTSALKPGERRAIRGYIARGGSVLWLTEPDSTISPEPTLPVTDRRGVVQDPGGKALLAVDNPDLLLIDRLPDHPVTHSLDAPLLLVQAAALKLGDTGSWKTSPIIRGNRRQTLPGAAGPSSLLLGTAMTSPAGARAAVLGDSDFLTNTYLGNGDNLRFGLQLMDWLAHADGLIGTYVSPAPDQRLTLTRTGAGVLAFGLLAGIPLLLLAGALVTWRRLRRG